MLIEDLKCNGDLVPKYRKVISGKEEEFESLARILNLGGNPIRLKILYLLTQENNVCVNQLSEILEISISSTSQHLRKLKDCRVLKSKKEKQTVYYFINPKYKDKIPLLFKLMD